MLVPLTYTLRCYKLVHPPHPPYTMHCTSVTSWYIWLFLFQWCSKTQVYRGRHCTVHLSIVLVQCDYNCPIQIIAFDMVFAAFEYDNAETLTMPSLHHFLISIGSRLWMLMVELQLMYTVLHPQHNIEWLLVYLLQCNRFIGTVLTCLCQLVDLPLLNWPRCFSGTCWCSCWPPRTAPVSGTVASPELLSPRSPGTRHSRRCTREPRLPCCWTANRWRS